ncbi:MAG: glycosyltransferase [Candidatus Levybacteria bacterium]|nr:glycosyltransferase [Candidatus Levybacteria bacterium]MBI2421171.1 glycosyltransferase [Candidatus Levybacteria bacterium]
MKKTKKQIRRVAMLNPQGYVQDPAPLGKTDTGGQTLYVLQLSKALAKKNIKVDIITRQFDNQPEEEKIAENVKIIRIKAGGNSFIQKEKLYEVMPDFVDNLMISMQKRRKEYDIIHSHYWDGGYAGNLLSKMLDVPHVHTPHSLGKLKKVEMMAVEELPLQRLKPMYRYHVRIAIEQQIINKADAVVVICETSRIQILQHYLIEFEKLQVIYPGIETDVFKPQKNGEDKRIKLEPNSILTVSRLVPAKGIDRLIDALALLKNKTPFHLYIGGDTLEYGKSDEEVQAGKQIQAQIKKYKLEKLVTFLGMLPHDTVLPAYYRAADVFVLPARYEPFGLTTLEAMASGTASIVSNVAGSREVIIDGLNGFLVDTHDRKKLAEYVSNLLKDAKLNKKVSQNAAFTVQEHYSWDKIVEQFIKLYKGLL